MAKSTNIITLSFTDEELKTINDFYRDYVLTTGDVTLRRAVLMKIFLLKAINQSKAVENLAKIRRIR